jgi:hypothetical protein
VLKGTWVFKIKRYPSGEVRKFKARYCVRGDMQVEGVDFFDTYAPVVSWITIRLMLVLMACLQLYTIQVDFSNAFAHATLQELIFVEIPKGFDSPDEGDYVLQLDKSLYGLRQAPLTWYEHLKAGLEKHGFRRSALDPCLFIHEHVICVVYVDDCLFFARDRVKIDQVLDGLKKDNFTFTVEKSVEAFLGIKVEVAEDGVVTMTQPGLIDKILATLGLENCAPKATPAEVQPLQADATGPERREQWNYASVVGMLLYVSSSTRPDIQFAVHQCARYTHHPRRRHEEAIKRIGRYLAGTRDKGITFRPNAELTLDCYVDADFAGRWGYDDDQDPVCVRSRTGYVLTFGGCPLLWVSKLQTEVALSTTEAEYIALSQAMRELLPAQCLVAEVQQALKMQLKGAPVVKSTVFEDNQGAVALANSPKMNPRTKHIGIKYHFFRDHVARGDVSVEWVESSLQKADILTKGLGSVKFAEVRRLLLGW